MLGAQELQGKLAHAKDLLAKMGGMVGGAAGQERGDAPRRQGPKPGGRDLLGKLGSAKDLLAKFDSAKGDAEGKLGNAQELLAKLGAAAGEEPGAATPRQQGRSKGKLGGDLLGKLGGAKDLLGKLQQKAPGSAAGARKHSAAERDPDRVRKLVSDSLPELLKVLEGSSGDDLQALAASVPQDVVKEAMSNPAVRKIVGKALGGGGAGGAAAALHALGGGHSGAHTAHHGTVHQDAQE